MRDQKGRFQKGMSGNPAGRPKLTGTRKAFQEKLTEQLYNRLDDILIRLDQLEGKEAVEQYIKLLPYTVPRLTASQIDMNTTSIEEFIALAPEERQKRINEIKEKLHER